MIWVNTVLAIGMNLATFSMLRPAPAPALAGMEYGGSPVGRSRAIGRTGQPDSGASSDGGPTTGSGTAQGGHGFQSQGMNGAYVSRPTNEWAQGNLQGEDAPTVARKLVTAPVSFDDAPVAQVEVTPSGIVNSDLTPCGTIHVVNVSRLMGQSTTASREGLFDALVRAGDKN